MGFDRIGVSFHSFVNHTSTDVFIHIYVKVLLNHLQHRADQKAKSSRSKEKKKKKTSLANCIKSYSYEPTGI